MQPRAVFACRTDVRAPCTAALARLSDERAVSRHERADAVRVWADVTGVSADVGGPHAAHTHVDADAADAHARLQGFTQSPYVFRQKQHTLGPARHTRTQWPYAFTQDTLTPTLCEEAFTQQQLASSHAERVRARCRYPVVDSFHAV